MNTIDDLIGTCESYMINDNELNIGNESIIKNIFKKKNNNLSKSPESFDQIKKAAKKDIQLMVQKIKNDPKTKEVIKKQQTILKTQGYSSSNIEKPSFTYIDNGEYIEIINGHQYMRSALVFILDKMVTTLNKKYANEIKNKLISFDTGDGDEGCIYIN